MNQNTSQQIPTPEDVQTWNIEYEHLDGMKSNNLIIYGIPSIRPPSLWWLCPVCLVSSQLEGFTKRIHSPASVLEILLFVPPRQGPKIHISDRTCV